MASRTPTLPRLVRARMHEPAAQLISEAQRKRLFAIGKTAGWSRDEIKQMLAAEWRIESTKDITTSAYEEICARLENPEPSPPLVTVDDIINAEVEWEPGTEG